jgi:DNA-binding XRE family transcriptional regulator
MSIHERIHPITRMRLARTPPLSIAGVARLASVSRTTLCKVENGHRDRLGAEACLRLAEAFPELDLKELLGWKWADEGPASEVLP